MPEDQLNIPALLERALQAQREGDSDSARNAYLRILSSAPNNPVALNRLAILDAEDGELDDAERLMRRAILQRPKEAAYYNNLANILRKKERYPDAIHAYQHALLLEPSLGDALNNLGALLLDAGQAKEAQSRLQEALELTGETAELRNNLGRALNNQGQLDAAVGEFTKAIALKPDYALAHLNLGHVLRAQGKFTYAAASFQDAIRIDPTLHKAYHGLGTVYMAQNIPEDAVACFEKALELAPDDFRTLIDLGVLLHSLGKLHQSVSAYKKAIRLRPDSAQAFNNLGAVLLERRNHKAAETAFRQAIQIAPGFVDPYAQLGAIFDEQGRLPEMQAVIEGGLRIDPEHKQLNFEAARLAARQGDMQKAVQLLSRFDLTRLDSRMGQQYRYELGRTCDRAGDPGMAYLHATEANRLATLNWRAQSINLKSIPETIEHLQAYFAEGQRPPWKTQATEALDAPVFIFGFPASGADFIAESLRHHENVQSLANSSGLAAAVGVAGGYAGGYPACLDELTAEQLQALRQVYFAQADKLMERDPACVLVDNQSINTMHAGMIWRLFPGARIIFPVRHPCDVVLGNFMQNYSMNETNAHFLTLEGTVALYEKVMRLWQLYENVLPLPVQSLRYEDLLNDFEPQIDSLLGFMGLEPDAAISEYFGRLRDGAEITGSSYRQQANPLDPYSRYRWRAYADQLRPFFARLQPFIEYYSYDLEADTNLH